MTTRATITIILALILAAAGPALSQTWHPANQATIGWDAVTKRADGTPVPSGDTIKYQVYTRAGAEGTPIAVGGEIAETRLTISFGAEGRYFAGVAAIRYPAGENTGIPSLINWSSDPLVCANGEAFGIVHYIPPATVVGLRPLQ